MKEPTWQNVKFEPINYQDIVYYSAPKKKKVLEQPRRGGSRGQGDVRQARHSARGAEAARGRRGRRGVRQRVGRDDVPGDAREAGHHLHVVLGGRARASRSREEVPRLGRSAHRQLLRGAELRGLQRRLVRLHPEGRSLPDGAVDLLPHQREGHRPVRAHARSSRTRASFVSYLEGCTAPMRDENQLHAAVVELVAHDDATIKYSTIQNWYPGDKEGKGGIYNFVDQARPVRGTRLEDHVDAGRDRVRRSRGNTRAASSRGTTRSASSTPWRRRTTGSRPTPARR